MTDEQRRVLEMLAEGKISVGEAERLLKALLDSSRRETDGPADFPGEESDDRGRDGETGPSMHSDSFEVGANPRLSVRGFNGRVRVHAGSPGSIRVRAKLKNPHLVEYSAVQEDDLVTVEARPVQSGGVLSGPFGESTGANIEVVVPAAARVDLTNSNGPVELRGTEGGGELQTANGRIKVESSKGDLDARTSNGAITVRSFEGAAELATSNSRMAIEDAHGRFEARTTNGSIKFQGSIEPGSSSRLATSNGSVKVTLDSEPSLKLAASTVNGRVRCDLPGFSASVDTGRKLEGTAGKGEAELTLETSNGSIAIQ